MSGCIKRAVALGQTSLAYFGLEFLYFLFELEILIFQLVVLELQSLDVYIGRAAQILLNVAFRDWRGV